MFDKLKELGFNREENVNDVSSLDMVYSLKTTNTRFEVIITDFAFVRLVGWRHSTAAEVIFQGHIAGKLTRAMDKCNQALDILDLEP